MAPGTFDKDAEHDPQLSTIALPALYARYEHQFAGYALTKLMKQHGQGDDAAKTARRINKALDAAFADLAALVAAVGGDGATEVPEQVGNDALLHEIYWRLHDHWNAETAPALQLVELDGRTPVWTDVEALFGELSALDHDAGDGDSFPSAWYEDLLARYDAHTGKAKAKAKAAKAAAKKPAPAVPTPPSGAEIVDYSPKQTFGVGQWVRHPRFGVGLVAEGGQHVAIEFPEGRKVLAHVPAVATPMPAMRTRGNDRGVNTVDLARAAGIEIKKLPPRPDEEK